MASGLVFEMADIRNIVLVINDLKGNGAERVVITLATGFTEAGHRASIVCFKDHIELPIPANIPVHIFSEKYFRWIPRSIRGKLTAPFLDRFIRKKIGLPDLVLSSLLPSDRIMAYSRLHGVHFVVQNTMSKECEIHNSVKVTPNSEEHRDIYTRKPCICVSKGVENDLRGFLDHKEGIDLRTIHNSIDRNKVAISASENPPDVVYDAIIHVGKFKRQKRQDRLIRAYHKMECSQPLVFVGQGEFLPHARALAKELNLYDKIHFLGFKKILIPT